MSMRIGGFLVVLFLLALLVGLFVSLRSVLGLVLVPWACSGLAALASLLAALALMFLGLPLLPRRRREARERSLPGSELVGTAGPDPASLVERLRRELEQSRQQVLDLQAAQDGLRQELEALRREQARDAAPFALHFSELMALGYHQATEQMKRGFLRYAISTHNGNKSEAARQLGLQRTYLYRLIKQLDVQA